MSIISFFFFFFFKQKTAYDMRISDWSSYVCSSDLAVLAELGLTVSDVVRMTLTRVAKDHALPFELKVPNAETRAAIEASRATMKARRARFTDPQEVFDALDQEARQQ